MNKIQLLLACSCVLAFGLPSISPAQQTSASSAQPRRGAQRDQITVSGRVVEVHAPRVFTIREAETEREILVLAPRSFSGEMMGANVRVDGTFRRLDAAQLKQSGTARENERILERYAGRQILVATSVLAALDRGTEPSPAAREPEEHTEPEPARTEPGAPAPPLSIRASVLAANLEEFAGQQVRVLDARVVGLLEPRAFLVEPATRYLKPMGTRDRVVVLIPGDGALLVPAHLLVGSIVRVEGVVRTVLGVRVTSEVPWPARLEPDALERLEVRGAVLARSVQTAEGVELTGRQAAAVPR